MTNQKPALRNLDATITEMHALNRYGNDLCDKVHPHTQHADRCDWIKAGQPYPNECGRTLPCDRHGVDAEGHPFGFTYHPPDCACDDCRAAYEEGFVRWLDGRT